ncbi:MAG: hypothetical protein VKK63_11980, partial [Synechococcus sp.]|nr:hypothetical protein [Synechococcus sp.]
SSTVGEYVKTTSTINSAPRFDHDPTTGESLGLLVEESRTNLLTYSEDLSQLLITRATVTVNTLTAPDGTLTADKLEKTLSSASYTYTSQSFTQNTAYSFSVFAKSGSTGEIRFTDFSTGNSVSFNLATATVENTDADWSNAKIEEFANNWYRVSAIFTPTTTGSRNVSYAFINTATIGDYAYFWGAQLEEGSFSTSYIPTEGTTVTRAASLADLINSAIANNIRSFYVEFRSPASGTCGVVSLNDSTANERAAVITSGTDPKLVVVDGGTTQADIDAGTVTAGVKTRVAVRIGTNDFAISINGGAVVTDTSGTLPTMDRLMIGRTQAGEYLNGTIARYTGWTESLADSTLQSLTQ